MGQNPDVALPGNLPEPSQMSAFERLLASVPPATYVQQGVAATQKWAADYNVACWVRGRSGSSVKLTLLLRYRDASGERQVMVDRADCRQQGGMLLAGRIALPATGKIEEMSAWLLGDPLCEVDVDELYVQRVGSPVESKSLVVGR